MNIYFAGSIRGGREDVKLYAEIIKYLRKYGNVLTEHIADENLADTGERNLTDKEIHDRDMEWLTQSDVIVAEVTSPSLGVGYEIRAAIKLNKKVLCLYRPHENKRLSAMISGSSEVVVKNYQQLNEAIEIIDNFFLNV
jgi:nucleoside 2-deoxyribosyltransferase